MTRAKTKRPGSRNGRRSLPDDLPDAAEAALDELLRADEDDIIEEAEIPYEDRTQRRSKLDDAVMAEGGTMQLDDIEEADDDEVVTELPVLRVGVFEDATHVRSAQSAVSAAGHVVAIAGSGADGKQRVLDAVRAAALDTVLVTLPAGQAIVDAALALESKRPVVIASVESSPLVAVNRASAAGADLVAIRPHDIGTLAPIMLAANRLMIERTLAADPEPHGLVTYEAFQRILELAIVRAQKLEYPLSIALFSVDVSPPPPPGIGGIVRARAGNAVIQAIREIDVATQLEGDRFLVLMPYTDLKRGAALAQQVIAAVQRGEPVVSGGRPYPPRIVGAAVSARLSAPVSFAKLLKDAMSTLDQARRDGADLAVQP